MEMLSCKTPAIAEKEIWVHLPRGNLCFCGGSLATTLSFSHGQFHGSECDAPAQRAT